tara:strand:+ start:170 stop:562 length:393 start_codon:yes stop_codon:yes gene_type:complete
MDKQAVIKTFTELQAVEIEFNIFTESGASYKDWPYEVDSIEFSDVDYDMVDKRSDDYPEAIRDFAYAYFDLVAERFHASEGILIEAVHAYCKTLPEYQKQWKAIENEDSFLTVSATIQDNDLLVIFDGVK